VADKKPRLDELQTYDLDGTKTRIVELYTVHSKTIAYIAQAIGRSANFVSKVLHEAYREQAEQRELRILAHSQAIEWMMGESMNKIRKGWDRKEVELWLKLRDTEARLKGLDQPVKAEIDIQVEHRTDEELISQLEELGLQIVLPPAPKSLQLNEHIEDAVCEPAQQDRSTEGDPKQTPPGSG
jgi:hypothetical protein